MPDASMLEKLPIRHKPRKSPYNLRLEDEVIHKLKVNAIATNRSASSIVEWLVRTHLEDVAIREAPPS